MSVSEIQNPKKKHKGIIVGIDFGTTNSVVAVFKDQKSEVIPSNKGAALLPSIVGVLNNKIIIGQDATKLSSYIPSIKRLIAEKTSSIVDSKDDCKVLIGYASEIFKQLKQNAESYLHCEVNSAVVTVPAHFDNSTRNSIKDAAAIAGLDVKRLLSEPTAAALFHGVDKAKESGRYLVYDMGGGTFDVSILEFHKGIFKVAGTGGDHSLGGDDLDEQIALYLQQKYNIHPTNKLEFLNLAKKLKEDLSLNTHVSQKYNNITITLSNIELDSIIGTYIDRTIKITTDTLKDLELSSSEIEGVLLVGGSTRLKLVREAITKMFGAEKIISDVDPDTIVARGAALLGSFLSGTNPDSIVLLDVLGLSLGIETLDGTMEKLIEKDSPIPIRQASTFTNAVDCQTSFKIKILQGEREFAKDNMLLGEITLDGIPPLPAGKARIEVSFAVDENGILSVSAQEKITGAIQKISIDPYYGLKPNEIDEMIDDSYKHLHEDITMRSLVEARNHGKRIISIVQNAIKDSKEIVDSSKLHEIQNAIDALEQKLHDGSSSEIKDSIDNLELVAETLMKRRLEKILEKSDVNLRNTESK